MPVSETVHYHLGECPCCGNDTVMSLGTVTTVEGFSAEYLCKWAPECPDLIAFLLSLFDDSLGEKVAVGISFVFEINAFTVQSIGDYPWTDEELSGKGPLCDRTEVIGTDLAKKLFKMLDEIWLEDPYLSEFVGSRK